jgi:murein DD-endopeptidase MepM/ murein hydrolase activator NlpD
LFLRIPFLVLVLIITTGKAAYAENNFRVESLPKAVKQGNVCLIRALGPTPLKSIHGEFQGKRFPMALSEQSGAYEGFLGIDLSTRPAKYKIKVVAIDEKSRVYSSTLSLKVERVHFGVQNLSLPSSMVDLDAKTLERVNREESQLEAVFQGFRDERLWRGAFILPVEGELSTTFGLNRMINGQRRGPHTGIDLRAEEGAPVLACNSAVVVLFDELFFSGKSLILDHGWGLYSMYFHLSEALVKEGDRVSTGTLMGRVGATGRSTGPHLHWGIRMNGARVDPLSLIRETSRF